MANLTEKNDILNLELREKLKEKFDKLKEPKKYIFKTNCIYRFYEDSIRSYNLHAISDMKILLEIFADLTIKFDSFNRSKGSIEKYIDLNYIEFTYLDYKYSEWVGDIFFFMIKLKYKNDKEELEFLDKKLKELESNDLKTENILKEIEIFLSSGK